MQYDSFFCQQNKSGVFLCMLNLYFSIAKLATYEFVAKLQLAIYVAKTELARPV